MIAVLATLLSGLLFYLSQGLDELWVLAWIAPVPLLWLAYGKIPYWQLLLASATAFFAGLIYAFRCYPMLPLPLLLSVIVPDVVLFPIAVIFARMVQRRAASIGRASSIATLFAFPACWTVCEYAIGLVSPHGSYGSLAYSQMSAPLVIQSASLFGLYSVTFLICLFANAMALATAARRETLGAAALGVGLCALNVVFGSVRLAQPQLGPVTVAALVDETAIVAAYHQGTLAAAVNVSDTYARAIRAAASQGATLAVTPEGGILSKEEWRAAVLAPLVAASKDTGIQIVAGVYERMPSGDLAFSITSDGIVHSYAKRHLVPLLEAEFTPGRKSGLLDSGLAMEICKDMDFQRTIRADAAGGGGIQLMAVPAGDFGKDGWLHARMAIMRGVENGFALVRAANDGLVTASDAEGRVIARKTVAAAGMTTILARLSPGPGPTLYTHIGDAFAWLCAALMLWIAVGRRSS